MDEALQEEIAIPEMTILEMTILEITAQMVIKKTKMQTSPLEDDVDGNDLISYTSEREKKYFAHSLS